MLISPLMGPIMATGLGLAVGDFYLTLKAIVHFGCEHHRCGRNFCLHHLDSALSLRNWGDIGAHQAGYAGT